MLLLQYRGIANGVVYIIDKCLYVIVLFNIMYNYVQHNAIIMINNDFCNDIAHE